LKGSGLTTLVDLAPIGRKTKRNFGKNFQITIRFDHVQGYAEELRLMTLPHRMKGGSIPKRILRKSQ
jgi:hypothetical protein